MVAGCGGVFVSYRRADSSHLAGRLYDRLAGRFGEERVFIDVDAIVAGADFPGEIFGAVSACRVLLAIIGPGWLTAADEEGRRRIDDPGDIVRLEIEAALAGPVRVIPVLADGAVMPGPQDLPESLAALARRNAVAVRHETFRADARRLVTAVEQALAATDGPAAAAAPDFRDLPPAAPHPGDVEHEGTGQTERGAILSTRLFGEAERAADVALAGPLEGIGEELKNVLAANRDLHDQGPAWADAAESGPGQAGSGEVADADFRSDIRVLLEATAERSARSGLPPHLMPGADVLSMSRTVRMLGRVRRPGDNYRASQEDSSQENVDGDDRSGREGAYSLPSERDTRASAPPRPWEQVAVEHDRLVVLGDPGMGKSWLLRMEACRLAEAALAVPGGPVVGESAAIPVPVRADVLATTSEATLAEAVAGYLVREGLLPVRSRKPMRDLIAGGGAVLLIDALDEVPREASGGSRQAPRKRLEDLLARWAEQCPRAHFVVASRLIGYTPLPPLGMGEAELLPFTRNDIDAAIGAWKLPGKAVSWMRGQLSNSAVAGMARVPLLLALICSLAADLHQSHEKETLPRTRAELYREVVWKFLSSAHRASEHGAPASALDQAARQHLLDVLTHIAVTFARDPRGWIDRMSYRELVAAVKGAGNALADLGGSPGTVIERLSGKAGVLVPVGNPADGEQDYVFLHRTLAEYLVARYLHDLDTARRMEIIAEHQWFDPDWAEVIPILGGLFGSQEREKASDLVRHFLSQHPDPLHYAFRTALRILGEVAEPDRLLTPEQNHDLAQRTNRLIAARATRDMLTRILAEANLNRSAFLRFGY